MNDEITGFSGFTPHLILYSYKFALTLIQKKVMITYKK